MNEKLKPCPFCGSDKIIVQEHKCIGFDDSFGVECLYCKTQSYLFFESKKEAVEAWNRRVTK